MDWRLEARARSFLDRGEIEKAAGILRAAQARGSRANPRRANLLGVCEARLGRREAARVLFSSVLSQFPRDPAALSNLGNLAFIEGDEKTARDYYARAIEENVFLQEPRFNLARTYQYMGHFERAMRIYEEYLTVVRMRRWSLLGLVLLMALAGVILLTRL